MKEILTALFVLTALASPLAAKELTGTLQQIEKSGMIKIGYRQSKPPMSFLDKGTGPSGYSIDLCAQIVAETERALGKDIEVKYIQVSAKDRFDALAGNKIDILCGATTRTLSRGEIVDFTQLTFVTGASFMSLKGKKIRNNFTGKRIGVVEKTTTANALKELLEESKTEAEIVLFKSSAEALDALVKEKIDVYSADQVVLIGLALTSGNPMNFTVLPELFSYEPFALAVRRNDADFRLLADRAISGLFRSKKILETYDKWVGKFTGNRPTAFEALVQLNAIPDE